MPRLTSFRPGAIWNSFFGLLDIKSGAQIILFFGVLNHVAGVYGLLSAFTGGSFAQISYYIYSSATLGAFVWGIKAVAEENTSRTLRLAHLYLFDHLLQTLFTLHFAYIYYYATPHDGRRIINSQAQQDLIDLAISRGEVPAEREYDVKLVAEGLWRQERTTAAVCLVGIWSIKIYFITILYSYAAHLRSHSYHSLPLSSSSPNPAKQTSVDQYASTAPYEPTHPPFQARLPGLNDEAPTTDTETVHHQHSQQGQGSGRREVAGAEEAEEFKWDSDEEEQRKPAAK